MSWLYFKIIKMLKKNGGKKIDPWMLVIFGCMRILPPALRLGISSTD